MWNIEYRYIEDWLDKQDVQTVAHIFAALELLQKEGPSLGRPLVDLVHGSCIGNLKELRPASPGNAEIRILFTFDPQRSAVMLLAGDKAHGKSGRFKWNRWYKKAVPLAEHVYERHLRSLEEARG